MEVETSRSARPEVQATTIKVKRTPGAGASQWDDERRIGSRTENGIRNGEWTGCSSLVVLFKSCRFIQVLSFYSSLVVLFKSCHSERSEESRLPGPDVADSSLRLIA